MTEALEWLRGSHCLTVLSCVKHEAFSMVDEAGPCSSVKAGRLDFRNWRFRVEMHSLTAQDNKIQAWLSPSVSFTEFLKQFPHPGRRHAILICLVPAIAFTSLVWEINGKGCSSRLLFRAPSAVFVKVVRVIMDKGHQTLSRPLCQTEEFRMSDETSLLRKFSYTHL